MRAEAVVDDLIEGDYPANIVLDKMSVVRRLLPQQEEVEFRDQVVRVDNSWLHEAIGNVVKNANGDIEQRRSMLIEIADRLFVLQERVNAAEMQHGLKADDRRAHLEGILGRTEYRSEKQKESTVKSLLRRLWDAFVRFLRQIEPSPGRGPSGASGGIITGFRILIVLIVLAASVFGAVQLIKRRRRNAEKEKEMREVLGELIAEDVTVADLLESATEFAKQGDYRTAIRRVYIALLFELEQRGKLRLHRSKTNHDYLVALRSEREILPIFSIMTGTFEKIWYGQRRATEDEFEGYISRYQEATKL
ncbi:MAG: DUF4129 domain-containing protein [Acidobacteria bacterium]|nr:DUF4129 domain-containing protein [Acidobacteriota bacterium]